MYNIKSRGDRGELAGRRRLVLLDSSHLPRSEFVHVFEMKIRTTTEESSQAIPETAFALPTFYEELHQIRLVRQEL